MAVHGIDLTWNRHYVSSRHTNLKFNSKDLRFKTGLGLKKTKFDEKTNGITFYEWNGRIYKGNILVFYSRLKWDATRELKPNWFILFYFI